MSPNGEEEKRREATWVELAEIPSRLRYCPGPLRRSPAASPARHAALAARPPAPRIKLPPFLCSRPTIKSTSCTIREVLEEFQFCRRQSRRLSYQETLPLFSIQLLHPWTQDVRRISCSFPHPGPRRCLRDARHRTARAITALRTRRLHGSSRFNWLYRVILLDSSHFAISNQPTLSGRLGFCNQGLR